MELKTNYNQILPQNLIGLFFLVKFDFFVLKCYEFGTMTKNNFWKFIIHINNFNNLTLFFLKKKLTLLKMLFMEEIKTALNFGV